MSRYYSKAFAYGCNEQTFVATNVQTFSWQTGRSFQAMVLYPGQDITLDQHTVPYLVGKIPQAQWLLGRHCSWTLPRTGGLYPIVIQLEQVVFKSIHCTSGVGVAFLILSCLVIGYNSCTCLPTQVLAKSSICACVNTTSVLSGNFLIEIFVWRDITYYGLESIFVFTCIEDDHFCQEDLQKL